MATTNYHNKESGSLITFIIVGVVLLGLTVGGIYLAKQRGETILANDDPGTSEQAEPNSETEQTPPAENEQENTESEGSTNDQPVEAPNDETDEANSAEQNEQSEGVAGTESNNDGAASQPEVAVAPRTGGQASQIPATGLEDHLLSSAIAFTALTYGGIRYAQSRRRLSQL